MSIQDPIITSPLVPLPPEVVAAAIAYINSHAGDDILEALGLTA